MSGFSICWLSFFIIPLMLIFAIFILQGVIKIPVDEKMLKKVQQSRRARPKLNKEAKLAEKQAQKDPKGTKYRCVCCGEQYNNQNNFYRSNSPLFKGNNGFVPICRECMRRYFDYVADTFSGNEEQALQVVAGLCDYYYCDELAASSAKRSAGTHRLSSYISKVNMAQYSSKKLTYLDTIKELADDLILTYDQTVDETGVKRVSDASVDRWGLGFKPEEYAFMDKHYKQLKLQVTDDDPMKEVYLKDMCTAKLMQGRAVMSNQSKDWETYTKRYQDTAKLVGLNVKNIDEDANSAEACWGNFIKSVEEFAPAELYKDKTLFTDVDGILDWWNRFIVRPFRNFFTGSNEMDKEYVIHAGDESDE